MACKLPFAIFEGQGAEKSCEFSKCIQIYPDVAQYERKDLFFKMQGQLIGYSDYCGTVQVRNDGGDCLLLHSPNSLKNVPLDQEPICSTVVPMAFCSESLSCTLFLQLSVQ